MDVSAVDYDLPPERVAQHPVTPRDSARLLVDGGPGRRPDDRTVHELPALLRAGDVVVVNDTKVRPARLHLVKASGGHAEVLLLDPGAVPGTWEALVRPGRKLPPGTTLAVEVGGEPVVEVGEDLGDGRRAVRLLGTAAGEGGIDRLTEAHGTMPLPPYITEPLQEPDRYQTVYARTPGSAAAPTAGLHFTDELLDRCRAAGATIVPVELKVGLGTFRPLAVEKVEDHRMHRERYDVPEPTLAAVRAARAEGRRVVAIGTTAVRALESAAATGARSGSTELFIRRPYRFQAVDVLLTNFHLPRSSLLVLIDAFIGPRWRELYAHALEHGYRFLSFGDAMVLHRDEAASR